MKILIAEDEPTSLLILETALLGWGYDAITVNDGLAAWDVLSGEDPPSLAVLDIQMPGIDGLEVCRRVRTIGALLPPYLILLSGMDSKEDVTNGIRAGANDYLTKPFYRDELGLRIANGFRTLELQSKLANRVTELEFALAQVKKLEGLLTICSYCKKIRDDEDCWHKIDNYISDKTDVEFSHSVCPGCYSTVVEDLQAKRARVALPPQPVGP